MDVIFLLAIMGLIHWWSWVNKDSNSVLVSGVGVILALILVIIMLIKGG